MRLSIAAWLGWWLTGCATTSRGKTDSSQLAEAQAAAARPAETVDYSPKAIQRRTEAQALFASGFLHDLNDEPDQAVEDFFKAGMADPSNEELVLEVSARLLRFKQSGKALELLKQASAEPDASALIFAQLGLAYSLADKKELAIEANRMAIKKQPGFLAGYRNLAQVYLQDGQTEEGLRVLDQAAKQPTADARFLTDLGELYLSFSKATPGDTVKARALAAFKRAAKEKPIHPIIIERLADGFAFLGELDEALPLYQELLGKYPDLSGLREKVAEVYLRKKDYAKAAEQFQALIRLNPTSPQAYYFLGSIAAEAKKLDEAVVQFRKVIQLNPNFELAYYELASAYLRLSQPTNALATLEQARGKFKPNFFTEFYTAMAYYGLKQFTNTIRHLVAAEVVAMATDTNRLNNHFYFQLGAAYERNQQYDEAEKYFRKCLALSPEDSEALNYLGYMWADRGVHLDEAQKMIEKAVKSEPDNAAFLDSLGWVLFKLNKPREALPHLLKAIQKSKEPDATLQDHLGDVYRALQEPEKARSAWLKSLAIEPNENKEQVKKKLEALPAPPKSSADAAPL